MSRIADLQKQINHLYTNHRHNKYAMEWAQELEGTLSIALLEASGLLTKRKTQPFSKHGQYA